VEQLAAAAFRSGEILLEALQLLLDAFQLLELLRRRLAFELARGAQLLRAGLELAHRTIRLEQLVEQLSRALAGEPTAPFVGLGPCGPEVNHARESRYASITWATPSSSTRGQMKSARASRSRWAFATATE